MGAEPQHIERQIEQTRRELATDVDALADRTVPSRVARRQMDRTRHGLARMKDRVMGTTRETAGTTGNGKRSTLGGVSDATSSAGSTIGDKAGEATSFARERTEGNPLAAGIVAFGVGWLVSSLIPSSQKEQGLAVRVEDVAKEHREPVQQAASDAAQEFRESMREPAQQAVAQVKETASDAAETVKLESSAAAGQVTDEVKRAGDHVRAAQSSEGNITPDRHI